MFVRIPKSTPMKARRYLKDLLALAQRKKSVSAYLFGTMTKPNSHSKMSDVDVLIIVSDELTLQDVKKLDEDIKLIEIKHGYRKKSGNSSQRFIQYIDDKLSLGHSHYIWRKSDFQALDSSKFSASSIWSELFAPRNILFNSIISEMKPIYGKTIRPMPKPGRITHLDLFRNFIVNFIMSLAALPLTLFTRENYKYSLTSIKWSAYGCAAFLGFKKDSTLENLLSNHFGSVLPEKFRFQFFRFRHNPDKDFIFSMKAVWYVLKLHLFALFKGYKQQ